MTFRNYDNIAPKSDRIINAVTLACAISACALILFFVVLMFGVQVQSVTRVYNVFVYFFFVDITLIAFALFNSIRELIRNPYPSAIFSLLFSTVALVCLVLFTVFCDINYGFNLGNRLL